MFSLINSKFNQSIIRGCINYVNLDIVIFVEFGKHAAI